MAKQKIENRTFKEIAIGDIRRVQIERRRDAESGQGVVSVTVDAALRIEGTEERERVSVAVEVAPAALVAFVEGTILPKLHDALGYSDA